MPSYFYKCPQCGARATQQHTIAECETLEIICVSCGVGIMRRVPQVALVTWGGLKPSQGELPYSVQENIKRQERK